MSFSFSEKELVGQISLGTCDVENKWPTWQSNLLATILWMNWAELENQVVAFLPPSKPKQFPSFMKVTRDDSIRIKALIHGLS